MNIFFTDFNVKVCAYNHCKVHVNKMIIEYAQLLSTAHHQLDDSVPVGIYRESHVNHPSTVWVRQARGNYQWLFKLLTELCRLYKKHKFKLKFKNQVSGFNGFFLKEYKGNA